MSRYARRPLRVGDVIRLTPGGSDRTVIRVTPCAAYVAGEESEVTIGDKTFIAHKGVIAIAVRAFVYPSDA